MVKPKTQREISISKQEPYDKTQGNPNSTIPSNKVRGNQKSSKGDTVKPFKLGFEEIDNSILYYLENVIKPTVIQNGVVTKVPVIYNAPERWKQFQKEGYYRDKKGKIMMPFMAFKLKKIEKNRGITNKLDANSPHNVQIFTKSYSSRDTYSKFNLLNNRIPEKTYYPVIVPDYIILTYEFIVSTYYVSKMNGIIEAINYASDSYWGYPEKFKFRARINSFGPNISLPLGDERIVKSTFDLKLYGYIVPDNIQKELSYIKKFNNKTKVTFDVKVVENI